ncbi:MAG: tetratricopeptide repeat protein [Planctomycetota bacterium]
MDRILMQPARSFRHFFFVFLLVAVTAFVFSGALQNDFVYFDDDGYVAENRFVQMGLSLPSIRYAFTTTDLGNWIPLTWLSFLAEAQLFGVTPFVFHATNLALHCLNVWLLFVVLRQKTGRINESWCIALLWGIHPLRTESVVWIAERKDLLSTTFLLLVFLLCIQQKASTSLRSSVLTHVVFILGLMAKPMLVTVPVLLAIFDDRSGQQVRGRFVERLSKFAVREVCGRGVMYLISFVFGIVTIFAQKSTTSLMTLEQQSIPDRLLQCLESLGWYSEQFLFPHGLSPYYPLTQHVRNPMLLLSGIALVVVSVFWSLQRRDAPWVRAGFAWFFVSILPVVGLIRVGEQAYADRYTYVPAMGLTAVLVFEWCELLNRLVRRKWLRSHRPASTVVMLVSAALLSAGSIVQTEFWHDPKSLWTHALDVTGPNWMAHFHLGRQALKENDANAAARQFETCLKLRPGYVDTYLMLAGLHQSTKSFKTASEIYRMALEMDAGRDEARFNLGLVLREMGQSEESLKVFREIRSQGFRARAEVESGRIAAEQNNAESALAHFEQAVLLDPQLESAYESAAFVNERLGELDLAMAWVYRGIRAVPDSRALRLHKIALCRLANRLSECDSEIHALLRVDPENRFLRECLEELERGPQKER